MNDVHNNGVLNTLSSYISLTLLLCAWFLWMARWLHKTDYAQRFSISIIFCTDLYWLVLTACTLHILPNKKKHKSIILIVKLCLLCSEHTSSGPTRWSAWGFGGFVTMVHPGLCNLAFQIIQYYFKKFPITINNFLIVFQLLWSVSHIVLLQFGLIFIFEILHLNIILILEYNHLKLKYTKL